MPNHITNYVRITPGGPETRALVLNTEGEEPRVDFNLVIPEPPEITNTTSPVRVVDTQEELDAINARWEETRARFGSLLGESGTAAITQEEYDRRIDAYGAADWYEWRWSRWGVKWNAYSTYVNIDTDDELCVQFDSPWGPPTPVFEEWERRGLTVVAISEDEDWGAPLIEYGDVDADPFVRVERERIIMDREAYAEEFAE